MERDPIDEGLAAALRLAQSENYLGNPEVVNSLLRQLVLFAQSAAEGATDGGEWAGRVNTKAAELAAIFTGRNPQFTAVPAWNTDAQMLAQMRSVGAIDADAQTAVRSILLRMVGEFFDTVSWYAERANEAEGKVMCDVIFTHHTNLFLGIATEPDESDTIQPT